MPSPPPSILTADGLKQRLGPLRPVLGRLRNRLRGSGRWFTTGPFASLTDEQFVEGAYRFLLQREADAGGRANYLRHLRDGTMSREAVLAEMRGLDEFWFGFALTFVDPAHALHRSRCLFVQQFPRAPRILDLGGTHQQSRDGALVLLGYPYEFEQLVVVDLPVEERHALYQQMEEVERVRSRLGPVEYHYRSMVDLSSFEPGSFDLVYSGQSIEHVTEEEGDQVLREVWRVLRPGGALCLDTPNGRACRLQLRGTGLDVTNPDHKIEYTHEELSAKVTAAGFRLREAKGLNHLPRSFEKDAFSMEELAASTGVYDAVEDCYLLAYVCEKPA